MLTLNVISDDYENLVISIAPPVVRDGAKCGLTVEKEEIVRALAELVELGWAKAYYLGLKSGIEEIQGMPSLEEMEDFNGAWFYITEAGRRAQDSYPYPFDDKGEMKKDWTPPEG